MSVDNWCGDFPRLSTLKNIADNEGKGDFFSMLPSTLSNPLAREFFVAIENDLAELSEEAWREFRSDMVNRLPAASGDKARRAVGSVLNEVNGYCYLKKEGFSKINFIPRAKVETPEMKATLNGAIVALLEVKTVWQSDYQNDWIEENSSNMRDGSLPTVRRIAPSFPDGLKNKLRSDVQKAKSQLHAYPASTECRRIVYFVVHLDFEQQNTPGITTEIRDYLSGLESGNNIIEIVCDFQNAFA